MQYAQFSQNVTLIIVNLVFPFTHRCRCVTPPVELRRLQRPEVQIRVWSRASQGRQSLYQCCEDQQVLRGVERGRMLRV
ncbi:hypothetical protein DPMN_011578 [Dreissena polymorpha]|uniref:Uncharacterized protein n=1 Tax=Dreissena polymorpha TaxID=45954 RepID=A0A9D4N498_DREPO|nr:hypothetical protein DPMN_011578 [Dreissena polymorpha]